MTNAFPPSPARFQEIPTSVAQDQLESAIAKRVEATTGVASVDPDGGTNGAGMVGAIGFVGATVAMSASMILLAAVRRRRRRAERARAGAAEEIQERHAAPVRGQPAQPPRMIELPPHVVATLDRLARERAEDAHPSAEAEDAPVEGGHPGFEAWIS